MKNNLLKKIITVLLLVTFTSTLLLALSACGAVLWILGIDTRKDMHLATPTNLSYDQDNYLLTWDEVENADSYLVDINGTQNIVEENRMVYVPVRENSNIKVKAMDSTWNYTDSDWSNPYTYTVTAQDEFSYSQVSAYVSNLLRDKALQKVVSAYTKDNSLFVNAVFKENGKMKLLELQIDYNNEVLSIKDAINQDSLKRVRLINRYDIANYDSASYLLRSNSFSGEMEQRRLEGYEFSVVSSQVVKSGIEDETFYIYSTYKLTKGSEVKYIQQVMRCFVPDLSNNERTNFTTKLSNPDFRLLKELSYTELTGDALDLAKMMEQLPEEYRLQFTQGK